MRASIGAKEIPPTMLDCPGELPNVPYVGLHRVPAGDMFRARIHNGPRAFYRSVSIAGGPALLESAIAELAARAR